MAKKSLILLSLIIIGFFTVSGTVFADYPKKPVTMIVAYSPGGGTDTAARIVAKYVQPYLGQRLVIQNKPGAGGQIGSELVPALQVFRLDRLAHFVAMQVGELVPKLWGQRSGIIRGRFGTRGEPRQGLAAARGGR